jgi:hypothetical protein
MWYAEDLYLPTFALGFRLAFLETQVFVPLSLRSSALGDPSGYCLYSLAQIPGKDNSHHFNALLQ